MRLHACAVFLSLAVLAGCQPTASATPTFPAPVLWESPTLTRSPVFPTRAVSLTPTLAPTPTPRTYTVRQGDTYGSIAATFGVTVDDLIKANPSVDPNALPIGQVLVIPVRPAGSETPQPTPTPVGLGVDPPDCYVQPSGGKWCLVLVNNPEADPVSSVFIRFSLYASAAADPSVSREVPLPLTVLPAGARTVAAAFFPPDQAQGAVARVELVSAIRTPETPGILPLVVTGEEPRPRTDGLELSITFRIDSAEPITANRLDAVLVLLDHSGKPVGFRILRSQGEWPSGAEHALTLGAFLLAGRMDSYEFILQARRELEEE
jgi:LysM repeat protein